MKILLVSTSDRGGAAKACIRLHLGLLENGIDSKLLLLHKTDYLIPESYQYEIKLPKISIWKRLINKTKRILKEIYFIPDTHEKNDKSYFLRNRPLEFEIFSFPFTNFDFSENPLFKDADIINLHWVSEFFDYKQFPLINKPIVWTLHDMNPFTGGCHYSGDCKSYNDNCSNCPQLIGTVKPNYSEELLYYKLKHLNNYKNLAIVSPSEWLLNCSMNSKLFKYVQHNHIPYGLNKEIFKPRDRKFSKNIFGINPEKIVIMFTADGINNKRKGFEILLNAIKLVYGKEKICILSIGNNNKLNDIGIEHIPIQFIKDERFMSVAYSAADILITPSLEDNLPLTVMESLMCGNPVIGFSIGGVKEMIEHQINGFIADDVSPLSLSKQIQKFINFPNFFDRNNIRSNTIKKYDSNICTKKYLELYNNICK
ncbi:MAG: glycosyltransferase [Bacteroidota bacterium]|nr:glycosyltransferase [Bacteroidota bacterium]